MNYNLIFCLLLAFAGIAMAKVYFEEHFDDDWESRWVISKKRSDLGKWEHTAGTYFEDEEADKGIKTSEDYRFYHISAPFAGFKNDDSDLVLQYRLKHEQLLGCGGAYVKLLPEGYDSDNFDGDTEYLMMFGPDKCGGTNKIHLILPYARKGEETENVEWNDQSVMPKGDQVSHLYTVVIRKDGSYSVSIDGEEEKAGQLSEDWDFLPPKEIEDPSASKPEDWDEREFIVDASASKPSDWDDAPEFIEDSEAEQPEDWDEELDGPYQVPTIPNPEYKGEWEAPKIKNPAYKGIWTPPLIANPAYYTDDNLHKRGKKIGGVGIEIWQVEAGSLFSDIIVASDEKDVQDAQAAFSKMSKVESALKKEADDLAAEEAAAAAEAAKADAPEDDEEEHDEL